LAPRLVDGEDRRQEPLALRLARVGHERRRQVVDALVGGRAGSPHADVTELLGEHGVQQRRRPPTADVDGPRDAEQAARAEEPVDPQQRGEVVAPAQGVGQGARGPVAHLAAHRRLVG
jgi:hypothetical protein